MERTQPDRSDWSWLEDTYWYVLSADLPALQLDTSKNALTWLVDQTVWHLTGYRSGYVWGVAAVLTTQAGEEVPRRGSGSRPMSFAMLGSVTPEGRVHLTFVPSAAVTSRGATIGIGCAVLHQGGWSLEMQMSSGNQDRTAHWAYMARTQPGEPSWDSLPGVGMSVTEMLEGCEAPQAPGRGNG